MANLMQQNEKTTKTQCRHHQMRCMWSLLHLLDFHRRFHMRKLLAYKKRSGNRKHRLWLKLSDSKPKVPSTNEEHEHLGREECPIQDKLNKGKSSPSRPLSKNLVLKKKKKEQGQKQKISPLASQLLRTISMHHLDSDDYLLPDSKMTDMESSSTGTNTHTTDFSAGKEHVPLLNPPTNKQITRKQCEICGAMNTLNHAELDQIDELGNYVLEKKSLLQGKLAEAKEMLSKQNSKGKEENQEIQQLQFFSKMADLFNINKELFLKFLQDPTYGVSDYLPSLQPSTCNVLLSNFTSFPGAELQNVKDDRQSATKENNIEESKHELINREEANLASQDRSSHVVSSAEADQVEKLIDGIKASVEETGHPIFISSMGTSADLLPGTLTEAKNERQSQPSVSHFRHVKDHIKEQMIENSQELHRISMDGVLHKIPRGQTLSDNIKKEEPGPCGLQPYSWDSLGNKSRGSKKKNKGLTRSQTLTESLEKYSHLLDITLSKESTTSPRISKLMQKDDDHQGAKVPKSFGRIFSLPEIKSHFFVQEDDSDNQETAVSEIMPIMRNVDNLVSIEAQHFDESWATHNHLNKEESLRSASHIQHEMKVVNNKIDICEKEEPKLTVLELGDPSSFDADIANVIHQTPLKETEVSNKRSSFCKPIGLNLDLDLDPNVEEIPTVSSTYIIRKDSELEQIPFGEKETLTSLQGKMENMEVDASKVQTPWETADISNLHFEVDEKDEAVFNLVREMLIKSILDSNELTGAYQQVHALLHEDTDSFIHAHDIEDDDVGMSPDYQLLFDLTNELLLGISESSYANFSWIPIFNRHTKPTPDGYHIMKEVWTSIKYLSSQMPDDSMFEHLIAQDCLKNNGWTTHHVEKEFVSQELEELILDDLLEEVINFDM